MQTHDKVLTLQVILHSRHITPCLTFSQRSNRTHPVVHAHIPHPLKNMHEVHIQRNVTAGFPTDTWVVSRSANSVRRRQVLTVSKSKASVFWHLHVLYRQALWSRRKLNKRTKTRGIPHWLRVRKQEGKILRPPDRPVDCANTFWCRCRIPLSQLSSGGEAISRWLSTEAWGCCCCCCRGGGRNMC